MDYLGGNGNCLEETFKEIASRQYDDTPPRPHFLSLVTFSFFPPGVNLADLQHSASRTGKRSEI